LKFSMTANGHVEELITIDLSERKKQLKAALDVPSLGSVEERTRHASEIAQIEMELRGKSKPPTVKDMADIVGQTNLYGMIYRYCSGAVHSTVQSLSQHIQRGPRGLFRQAYNGPLFDEVPFYLGIAMCVQLEFMRQVSAFFKIDYAQNIRALEDARSRLPPPRKFPNG
jgi:hypothetical protein